LRRQAPPNLGRGKKRAASWTPSARPRRGCAASRRRRSSPTSRGCWPTPADGSSSSAATSDDGAGPASAGRARAARRGRAPRLSGEPFCLTL